MMMSIIKEMMMKAMRARKGMVINPSQLIQVVVQGIPVEQTVAWLKRSVFCWR